MYSITTIFQINGKIEDKRRRKFISVFVFTKPPQISIRKAPRVFMTSRLDIKFLLVYNAKSTNWSLRCDARKIKILL